MPVIECKNANKEEVIALGIDQIRRYNFTGTPIDKAAYGRGTFKTFACEDYKGYLRNIPIAESIEDRDFAALLQPGPQRDARAT